MLRLRAQKASFQRGRLSGANTAPAASPLRKRRDSEGELRFTCGVGRSYIGQSNQVTVPLGGAVDREKYGYLYDDVPVEIVNLRVLGELMN